MDNNKSLIVFVPIGVPGMGKSTFVNYFKEVVEKNEDSSFEIVSSDDLRKKTIDDLKAKQPQLT